MINGRIFVYISHNRRRVIWKRRNKFYYKDLYSCCPDDFFLGGLRLKGKFVEWLLGSNRFIIIDKTWIYNVETGFRSVYPKERYKYYSYDTRNNTLLINYYKFLEIYDVNTFKLLTSIKHNKLMFIAYSTKYNALITNGYEYYQVTDTKTKKVQIGIDYLVKRNLALGRLMDIMLFQDMLFDLLPNEILCTELCRLILNYYY